MKLDDFLNKYVVVLKRDGKSIEGILINILNYDDADEDMAYITLVLRIDDKEYINVHLIEVENIGIIE